MISELKNFFATISRPSDRRSILWGILLLLPLGVGIPTQTAGIQKSPPLLKAAKTRAFSIVGYAPPDGILVEYHGDETFTSVVRKGGKQRKVVLKPNETLLGTDKAGNLLFGSVRSEGGDPPKLGLPRVWAGIEVRNAGAAIEFALRLGRINLNFWPMFDGFAIDNETDRVAILQGYGG